MQTVRIYVSLEYMSRLLHSFNVIQIFSGPHLKHVWLSGTGGGCSLIRSEVDCLDLKISLSGRYHTAVSRLDQQPLRKAVDPAGGDGMDDSPTISNLIRSTEAVPPPAHAQAQLGSRSRSVCPIVELQ